ncbi:farnesyl pyrophosphate synthase isoform X1 [Latimeria chalumnae]|nr:PREDICTED: farnesyl pyrophosphate synthase isoform X1 [Latimeria chalumnae]XP_006001698.1 PREDICTED: farnesyl pyrophosphate synthase isoform X1 [Latimeria chalumnae]|eukprot:XP_006001697.1 PREDICTED: farnesyl pyrophosphate synthase isoform X1 [Latimeria chalumnae]
MMPFAKRTADMPLRALSMRVRVGEAFQKQRSPFCVLPSSSPFRAAADTPSSPRLWPTTQTGQPAALLGLSALSSSGVMPAPLTKLRQYANVAPRRAHAWILRSRLSGNRHQQVNELAAPDLSLAVCRMSSEKTLQAQYDAQEFERMFAQIVKDLTERDLHHAEIGDAVARLKQVIEYNSPGGKRNRGLSVVASFRELARPDQQNADNHQRALVVGWCVELLQAFFLVADDIMDASITRRGQPCWYKKEGVGLDAINDSFLLEASIYRLLKKYCKGQPYYFHLLELFLEASYQTELGQALDLMTAPPNEIDLSRFTESRYKAIVKYKTAFYSFYLPVAAAMYMAGIEKEAEHNNAKTILLEMGEFFQIQDDYLDCYGDPAVTGKIGTDIEDNKCSWLVVEALKRGTPEQKLILEENYGKNEQEKVAKVKALYEDLDLKVAYREYEEQSYQRLMALINRHAGNLSKDVFMLFAQKIYKRQK